MRSENELFSRQCFKKTEEPPTLFKQTRITVNEHNRINMFIIGWANVSDMEAFHMGLDIENGKQIRRLHTGLYVCFLVCLCVSVAGGLTKDKQAGM